MPWKFKKRKKKKNNRGSALIFSMIILVNAILIVGSISLISVMERKISGKTLHTSTALQRADSGVEYVLQKVNESGVENNAIGTYLCDDFDSDTGKCKTNDLSENTHIYFLKMDGDEEKIITDSAEQVQNIEYIQSVGLAGSGQDQVSRSLKVAAGERFACGADNITDEDGTEYGTVEIGTRCWMAENMNVGSQIDAPATPSDPTVIEKYCYDNDSDNCDGNNLGGLYIWDEAMQEGPEESRGICPQGWHVATDEDWYDLEETLRNSLPCSEDRNDVFECEDAGNVMQQAADGEFNAKLGGYLNTVTGNFDDEGNRGFYWTSSEDGSDAYYRELDQNESGVNRNQNDKSRAYSVRCVRN
ncbi:MAG: FISUMP domain-containing protein [Candidatus Moranbacteria bacterium]|nr:FISUMP domain-containing protein [Candidatus Moranbacteria bacterium]